MSQDSQRSIYSVPPEIIDSQDEQFIEDINAVDILYFADRPNSELFEETEQSEFDTDSVSDNDHFESDNDEEDIPEYFVEPSEEDTHEYLKQKSFTSNTCGCKDFYGQPCSDVIDMDSAIEFREHCMEITREELDMIIKAELFSHRRSGSHTEAKKHKIKERERPYQEFYFKGKRVCRQTFCFIHNIEKKKLLAIAKSLDSDGLSPRVHGSIGKQPKHALKMIDTERIKMFLVKYAADNALPLPGRLPNYKNHQVLLLPSDKSSVDIHQEYETLAETMNHRSVSLRTFQRQWQTLCPHIAITKPCTDLCQQCQEFADRISKSGNLLEDEKEKLLEAYNNHVQLAKEQRDFYRGQVTQSKENYRNLTDDEQILGKF